MALIDQDAGRGDLFDDVPMHGGGLLRLHAPGGRELTGFSRLADRIFLIVVCHPRAVHEITIRFVARIFTANRAIIATTATRSGPDYSLHLLAACGPAVTPAWPIAPLRTKSFGLKHIRTVLRFTASLCSNESAAQCRLCRA